MLIVENKILMISLRFPFKAETSEQSRHELSVVYCMIYEQENSLWYWFVLLMVLISDGNSEIVVHVWSEIGNFSPLRYSLRSRAVANCFDRYKKNLFLCTCATVSELPSNISTMVLLFPCLLIAHRHPDPYQMCMNTLGLIINPNSCGVMGGKLAMRRKI